MGGALGTKLVGIARVPRMNWSTDSSGLLDIQWKNPVQAIALRGDLISHERCFAVMTRDSTEP